MNYRNLIYALFAILAIGILPQLAWTQTASASETSETVTEPAADAATSATETSENEAAKTEAAPAEAAVAPAEPSFESQMAYTINTLIMFICAVLVLFMQAGFAMLEVGLNAAKNTVNILFKNIMDLSVGVLLFLLLGFGLMYPGEKHKGEWFGYAGPMVTRDATTGELADYSSSADFLFQVAFAATAATIVSGAVAGRMKFSAYLIYSAFLTGLVYPISGMWKWGGGALAVWGFQDFAGSVVVHAVGGCAALAGAFILGPRIGRFTKDGKSVPMPGHNLAFAALGVFILWIGWYGFNPGSQLTYSGAANAEITTFIALTTTLAAAMGAVTAMVLAWALFGKPDVTMALNGALAGLVGITANCDQVTQPGAMIIGSVAGVLVVCGIILLDKLRIDDPVGAFPVHGLCGVWGGIATGLLGTNIPDGLTRGSYIWVQCLSTAIICGWAIIAMGGLFALLRVLGLLRVSAEDEIKGLDLSEHGMHAYPPSLVVDSYPGAPTAPIGAPAMAPRGKTSPEGV